MNKPDVRKRKGMSLGLVVVLCILGLGFLLPLFSPFGGERSGVGKKMYAKNDALHLVAAIKGYHAEYGKYPTLAAVDMQLTEEETVTLLMELRVPSGYTPTMNPRRIVFIEVPNAKNFDKSEAKQEIGISSSGKWLDPWGRPYKVMLSGDYDDNLPNPYYANAGDKVLKAGAIVWSLGRNGKTNTDKHHPDAKDDVTSWDEKL